MIVFYNLALLSSILISQPPAMVNQEINIMSLELYNEILHNSLLMISKTVNSNFILHFTESKN